MITKMPKSMHFKVSNQLKKSIRKKVGKLFDHDSSIIRAHVTLFEVASGNPKNQFCDIQLSVPGENYFVKKNSESYENSILTAVDALQKKIAEIRK
jgi:ribosome-associated translation inhibitor RaiA